MAKFKRGVLYTLFEHPFLGGVTVKGVRRCSARRARRIRGFNPHRRQGMLSEFEN